MRVLVTFVACGVPGAAWGHALATVPGERISDGIARWLDSAEGTMLLRWSMRGGGRVTRLTRTR